MAEPRLILASRSPRRAALLREAGFDFTQAVPPFADPAQPISGGRSPRTLAADLARQKALSLRPSIDDDAVILAADTLCVAADGRLIGTPASRAEARRILVGFREAAHEVITGVALLRRLDPAPRLLVAAAAVLLGPLADDQIDAYLDTDQWRGKAGGYNLSERLDAGWPLTVTGDPTTVVGLPMRALLPALLDLGVSPHAA